MINAKKNIDTIFNLNQFFYVDEVGLHIIEIEEIIHLKCANIVITISSQFLKVKESSRTKVSIKELLNYEKEDNNDSTKITPRKILQHKNL